MHFVLSHLSLFSHLSQTDGSVYLPTPLLSVKCSGTGSYPPRKRGLHLIRRQKAIKEPNKAPCLSIASMAKDEQVGRKRQFFFVFGEIFLL